MGPALWRGRREISRLRAGGHPGHLPGEGRRGSEVRPGDAAAHCQVRGPGGARHSEWIQASSARFRSPAWTKPGSWRTAAWCFRTWRGGSPAHAVTPRWPLGSTAAAGHLGTVRGCGQSSGRYREVPVRRASASKPGFPAATAAPGRTSPSSSAPVAAGAGCYPEPLRPPAWVPRLSDASPVSSSSAAWRTSPATASRS